MARQQVQEDLADDEPLEDIAELAAMYDPPSIRNFRQGSDELSDAEAWLNAFDR